MRGLLCKFKIEQEKARSRVAALSAKWRVLLYSAPVLALFAPGAVFAKAADPTKPGLAKALIGKAGDGIVAVGGAAVSGLGTIAGASIEVLGSLMVWLFIVFHLSKIFADLFSGIFLFLINFLIGVSQYNSFLGANIVTIGWTVTRDIANMFLVVALLVIAFATILNINSYQASSLLKEFFFAAILVNFSKMICGLFIDAAQVVMMTFVSGYAETAAGNFIRLFKVADWLQLALGTAKDQTTGQGVGVSTFGAEVITSSAMAVGSVAKASADFFTGITSNVLTAIIAFIGVLAVLSLDIILVVRIVTIWFLIVASPIAFVAKVLPVTKGFASQWWGAFMKQLIAGPLVAFIVWISLASIAVSDSAFDVTKEARQSSAQLFAEASATQTSQGQLAATKISQWENLALYFIPIVIFIMGAKWAVGVAGGAAKSITGFANKKLGGYARSGLSAFKKQAIGKGQFSVMSQAKKGFTGEGGFTTGLVGGVVGGGIHKFGGQKGEKFNNFVGSALGGERGRARTRQNNDKLANFASKLGLGDLGHKRHATENAHAAAQLHREQGNEAYAKEMAAASRMPLGPARTEAEELAKSNLNVKQKAAQAEVDKVADAQMDIFKADGLTDDNLLLKKMTDNVHHGHINEVELFAANKMIAAAYDKKMERAMAGKKAEFFEARDNALLDAAARDASPEEIKAIKDDYKWDTAKDNEMKRTVEKEIGTSKKDSARLLKGYTDPTGAAADDVKEATGKRILESNELRAKAAGVAKAAKDAQTNRENTAHEGLRTAQVNINQTYQTAIQTPGNHNAAHTNMARDLSVSALNSKRGGGSDAEIKISISSAAQLVPPSERPDFFTKLKRNMGASPIASLVDDVAVELGKITGQQAVSKINQRKQNRGGEGPALVLKDFGAETGSDGNLRLPPPAVEELAKAIEHDDSIIYRASSATSAHPDFQRAISHAVKTPANVDAAVLRVIKHVTDPVELKQILRNLSKAVSTHTDATIRAKAADIDAMNI